MADRDDDYDWDDDEDHEENSPTYMIYEDTDLDLSRLLASLTEHVAQIGSSRDKCSEYEQLTHEAFDCARSGMFEEACHRLRLRDEPKFASSREAEHRYTAAMRERDEVSR